MTIVKKWGLFFLSVFLIAVTASVLLGVRLLVPLRPASPYFPDTQTRLPQLHWLFGRFQPVFLYPFSRGDSGFLRVAYRDPQSKIRFLNVYVGVTKPAPSLLGVVTVNG